MTEQPDGGVTMRRAVMADRDELLTVLTRAFSRDEAHPIDFLSFVPHVFTPERIGDHLLYLEGGRILGRFDSQSLIDEVEGSLRRLGRDSIDVLLLHNPPLTVQIVPKSR